MTARHGYKPRPPGTVFDTLKRAIEQTPGGAETAADALGERWSRSRLYDATDPDRGREKGARLELDEARRWTRSFRGVTAFAVDFAGLAGGYFVPPLNPEAGAIGLLAARAGRENAEALQKIYDAYADGVLTRAEALAALPEIREACEASAALFGAVAEIAGVDPASFAQGEGKGEGKPAGHGGGEG